QKPIVPEKEPPEVPLPKPILSDIAGHWAQANIIKLVNAGVISGYPDATFQPDKSITRAEFVTAVIKAFKLESRSGQVFSDTAQHWAKESISTAAAYGMASGYDASSFCPDDAITREQMAVMISKAAKLPAGEGKTFIDSAQIEDWAQAAVAAASSKNIISGYPDNSFRPKANANRAEAVSVIVNALNTLSPAEENQTAK
ncbi:MAG: S-layer homology domain-containing protein, partial [Syntrophomonas sp.]|nr:S-layer homology domain-containing protein [Syntrophomonas sp.]